MSTAAKTRTPEADVNELFINRWSPRAFSGEPLSEKQVRSLIEAAKWAPSCYNSQPWRIVYARKGTGSWNKLFNLLVPFNQSWAKESGALFVFLSRTHFEHNDQPNAAHAYDTGAAWMSLALQAAAMGLAAHGMGGFDHERARADLDVPEGYEVQAMAAVGVPADKIKLPEELRAQEAPSGRKRLAEIAFAGKFIA
ncbi:MAG: nitroreductase family protein [Elusimicrobiota bacterium]